MLRKSLLAFSLALLTASASAQLSSVEKEFNKFKDSDQGEIKLETGTVLKYQVLERKKQNEIEVITAHLKDPSLSDLGSYGNFIITLNHNKHALKAIAETSEGHFDFNSTSNASTSWRHLDSPPVLDNILHVKESANKVSTLAAAAAPVGEKDASGRYVIDVFVGFSEAAAKSSYVNGDLNGTAQAYVQSVNTALKNSLVDNVYLRLVGTGVSPQNPGVITSALNDGKQWFQSDIERTAPDLIGLVQMPTDAPGGAGGYAPVSGDILVIGAPWPTAFRHEAGHSAGGIHCKGPNDTGFNYGYEIRPGRGTIQCGNQIAYYSTPAVRDNEGNIIGTVQSQDMARVWRERAAAMSAKRTHKIPFDNEEPVPLNAELSSPAPGSTLSGSLVNFSWNRPSGVTSFDLLVGTTGPGSTNIRSSSVFNNTSLAVSGLPTDGKTVYVRLWTWNGGWVFKDYTFKSYSTPATTGQRYQIKNRWKAEYIYDAGTNAGYTASPSNSTAYWIRESVSNGVYEFRNATTGDYLNIENLTGTVQATVRASGNTSSRWTLKNSEGNFVYIYNQWKPTDAIHIENLTGYAQHSAIQPIWWSAQWELVPVAN